jgi:hypothetical protein
VLLDIPSFLLAKGGALIGRAPFSFFALQPAMKGQLDPLLDMRFQTRDNLLRWRPGAVR